MDISQKRNSIKVIREVRRSHSSEEVFVMRTERRAPALEEVSQIYSKAYQRVLTPLWRGGGRKDCLYSKEKK